MKAVRYWSVSNARWLRWVYNGLEAGLVALHPVLSRLGYQRLDAALPPWKNWSKGFFSTLNPVANAPWAKPAWPAQ